MDIHKFEVNGDYILLDVNSGSVHILDDVAYRVLDVFTGENDVAVLTEFTPVFGAAAVRETLSELHGLIAAGLLFSPATEIPPVFAAAPIVKSLCLHIAHDCIVGDHCILANNATLAGHISIGDHVFLGGLTAVHQFCTIGAHAMTAGGSIVVQDIPPYVTAAGNHAHPVGINSEGLRRRGFDAEQISRIKRAYKQIYRQGLSLEDAKAAITEAAADAPELALFVDFFARAKRGIIR